MEEKYCQSCGMPMTLQDHFGTEANGEKNGDYCCYCYQKGEFQQACTMEEMIHFCLNHVEAGVYGSREQAEQQMKEWFPTLKRWRRAE